MKSAELIISSALLAIGAAQTPANFSERTDTSLLAYSNPSNSSIEPPGRLLAPTDVFYSPSVYLPSGFPSDRPYIGIQVDAAISALHWIQPNLVAQPDGNMTVDSSTQGASRVECPYLEPIPPPGGAPHAYVIMLLNQPASWTIPSNYSFIDPPANVYARLNFSLPDFLRSSGLGPPIAATFFRAMNGTAQASSVALTATVSVAGSTSAIIATIGSSATSTSESTPVASYTAGAAPAVDLTQTIIALVVMVWWLAF